MAFQEDFGKCNQCESLDCECESVITYRLLDKNTNRFLRDKEHAKNNPTQKDVLFTGLIG